MAKSLLSDAFSYLAWATLQALDTRGRRSCTDTDVSPLPRLAARIIGRAAALFPVR